jgi:hypothetical protein
MIKNNTNIEQYRVTTGPMASDPTFGNNGVFIIASPRGNNLICIASDGGYWDHVSVEAELPMKGLKQRCPYWDEMCFIKDLFWAEDECALQYHPKKKDYKNLHRFVLHIWKPRRGSIPVPPIEYV